MTDHSLPILDALKAAAAAVQGDKRHGVAARDAAADVLLERDLLAAGNAMVTLCIALEEQAEAAKKALAQGRQALLAAMLDSGAPAFSDGNHTASWSNGRTSVLVTSEAELPEPFWKVERKPDMDALAKALKDGQDVPGAVLRNGSPHLVVRNSRKERAA